RPSEQCGSGPGSPDTEKTPQLSCFLDSFIWHRRERVDAVLQTFGRLRLGTFCTPGRKGSTSDFRRTRGRARYDLGPTRKEVVPKQSGQPGGRPGRDARTPAYDAHI